MLQKNICFAIQELFTKDPFYEPDPDQTNFYSIRSIMLQKNICFAIQELITKDTFYELDPDQTNF